MDGEFRSHYAWMEEALRDLPHQLPSAPKAVLVISGHWEADEFSVSSASSPGMVYDYHGFPEHTYRVKYSAPGSPQLAEDVQGLLRRAGWKARLDSEQGLDHGAFSVLKPVFPDANVPVVQLSLKAGLDPAEHLAVGRALSTLRDEGVLILGSGMSYHNLRRFGPSGAEPSILFDGWLRNVLLRASPASRARHLVNWTTAPAARDAHPREEHLLPLMVVAGAAEDEEASCVYGEVFWGHMHVSSFRFGGRPGHREFDRLAAIPPAP